MDQDIPNAEPRAFTSRYVFPMASPPLANGVVVVADGCIEAVCSAAPSGIPCRDLGNVALLPGWVNAHTHLEFSSLTSPLGNAGLDLSAWIPKVVNWRRERGANEGTRAIRLGLRESARCGVAAIGEINTGDPLPNGESDPHDRGDRVGGDWEGGGVEFRELLGLDTARTSELMELATSHLKSPIGSWTKGLSPHAPYTVSVDLVEQVARLSNATGAPVAMHLAESAAELELLQSHCGPLREMLDAFGVWDPAAIPRGIPMCEYLRLLEPADRLLAVHGNFLFDEEIAYLATQAERASVVYCPRTHAYFQHGRYPLEAYLEAGVPVALGTDSRASNPDLGMLDEIRQVKDSFPAISPQRIIEMATVDGAKALGLSDCYGTLEAGHSACLAAVALPAKESSDPWELVVAPTSFMLDLTFTTGSC